MVKFSKELEAQLIPEWKDAFVNYWALKKNVKRIKLLRESKSAHDYNNVSTGFSIFDPFRYMGVKIADKFFGKADDDGPIIQVREDEESWYQTDLVTLFTEDDEVKEFFACLDEQLNKVNQFYKSKEAEFLERGHILNKQLHVLLDLKRVLHDRHRKVSSAKSDAGNSLCSSPLSLYGSESSETDEPGSDGSPAAGDLVAALEGNGMRVVGAAAKVKTKKEGVKWGKGKSRSGLRIELPATTPTRAISALAQGLWEDVINGPSRREGPGQAVNRKKVQCAEKMIRGAYVELYRGLGLLKTYSSLNLEAFRKILKKFDKVSNQQASPTYLKAVKCSYFISSDKVARMGDEVESLFTKHFAGNDRKRAMKFLRPQSQKGSHMVTFLVGLFTGCFLTLFCLYAFLAHLSGMYSPSSSDSGYMETVYPVFSMFALISLHIFLYGVNISAWRRTRINYRFIFDFSPTTALRQRDVFLICTTIMTLVVSAMVAHLILRTNGFSPYNVDAIPGVLFLIFTGLLVCPLNIFYRSTRYYFLRVMRNIVFSPFYKVLMVDFFMADQLTSQVPLLRHMEFTACYFLAGSFRTHHYQTCTSSKLYKELAYVISFMPYFWRAMQCARRWFDEGDLKHIANLGKYVSAMVAAGARLTYGMQPTPAWLALVVVTSTVATVYQLYWDFVQDWGLLNPRSKNPWLRDDLVLRHKSLYYLAIVVNFVLRLVWIEAVMPINTGKVDLRVVEFVVASLEVIRRGHWNYYRLENEHLNNVGKFRAVKAVPLPFQEMDDDE
ncbi:phosphate transporter PHO1-like [Nymphaea colorata]|nr:phosphate transporter PHO1-like [Nymphaea colorata]